MHEIAKEKVFPSSNINEMNTLVISALGRLGREGSGGRSAGGHLNEEWNSILPIKIPWGATKSPILHSACDSRATRSIHEQRRPTLFMLCYCR